MPSVHRAQGEAQDLREAAVSDSGLFVICMFPHCKALAALGLWVHHCGP